MVPGSHRPRPDDIVIIADGTDDAGIAAIGVTVVASGVAQSYTSIPLLTAEQLDAATEMPPAYRAPGT